MANIIDVLIRGIDGVSPVVNSIKSNVVAGFGMGLGMRALDGMLSGVGQLKSQMTDALKLQTQYITTASGFSTLSGVSFKDSTEFLKGVRTELGKIAAELPGTTQDYLDFAMNINGTLLKGYDVSDAVGLKTFQKDLIDITKRAELIGKAKGVGAEETAYYMKQFISENTTLRSLNPLSFDNKTPEFVDTVRKQLAQMGKTEKDLNKMSTGEKARILRTVLGQLSSNEMISALQGTADSIIEGWKDKIFSQDRGVLGFMREVESRAGRSALDGFTELLNRLNSLSSTVGKVLEKMGFTFDPMEAVIDFMSWLGNIVSSVEGAIVTAKNPGEILPNIFRELWGYVGNLFDSLGKFFSDLDPVSIGVGISDTIKSFFTDIPWGKMGVSLGVSITNILITLVTNVIGIAFDPQFLGSLLKGVLSFIIGLLVGIAFSLAKTAGKEIERFFKGIVDWFKGVWDKIKDAFEPIVTLVSRVVSFIGGLISKVTSFNPVSAVTTAVTQSPIGQAVQSVAESPVGKVIGGALNPLSPLLGSVIKSGKPGDKPSTVPIAPGATPLPQPSVTNNKHASNTFAPQVNVALGVGDNIANEVMGAIEQLYNRAQQGAMA